MVKDITFRITAGGPAIDKNLKSGMREGINEHGQFWKEEWEKNDVTGYSRFTKST